MSEVWNVIVGFLDWTRNPEHAALAMAVCCMGILLGTAIGLIGSRR